MSGWVPIGSLRVLQEDAVRRADLWGLRIRFGPRNKIFVHPDDARKIIENDRCEFHECNHPRAEGSEFGMCARHEANAKKILGETRAARPPTPDWKP